MNDNPYRVLLEEVPFGPLVARNRFFQVPHCNGMGYRDVRAHAEMRAVKAEGGWAVVCTEQAEIHYTSEITPFIEVRLWDDEDIPALAMMTERIHEHGALAGIELAYNGMNGPNLTSRTAPMGPAHLPIAGFTDDPVQARAMTLRDIANLRRWHRQAVRRSLHAGFDLVYVYGGHALGTIHHFLSPRYNQRTDAYGGSVQNRMRLLRELLIDTVEEVDGAAAVGCRITVEELIGDSGITRGDIEAVLGELGEIPDLWDFVMGSWEDDSITSRFGEEGNQEQYVTGLKALTSKPIVGVGRFTSPDTMARMVRQGVIDFIGAARPSIADPFLPAKIAEGAGRGDPRVHRLQHLRLRRLHYVAHPLHPKSVNGRRMAPRMAPGDLPAPPRRRVGAHSGCRTGWPRGSNVTREAGISGRARGAIPTSRRASCRRSPPARAFVVDPGTRLPPVSTEPPRTR